MAGGMHGNSFLEWGSWGRLEANQLCMDRTGCLKCAVEVNDGHSCLNTRVKKKIVGFAEATARLG